MAGNEIASSSQAVKKQKICRVTTACDNCRNKKVRCDGASRSIGSRCSICVGSNMDCTFLRVAKKRGPPKEWERHYVDRETGAYAPFASRYGTILETRLNNLETLLRKYRPDIDIPTELNKLDTPLKQEPTSGELSIMSESTEPKTIDLELHQVDDTGSSDYESVIVGVPNQLHEPQDEKTIFLGKSSSIGLFRQVMDMKNEYSGVAASGDTLNFQRFSTRRPEFWQLNLYSLQPPSNSKPAYRYPEPDLLPLLVDVYFSQVNIFIPVFHRPTFEQAILDGLHLRDESFGAVLLLVCSVGSSRSDNPALNPMMRDPEAFLWSSQVQVSRWPIQSPASLYEVQLYLLSALNLINTPSPEGAWVALGVGIRLCQDLGVHRQKIYGTMSTAEGERWKRLFWGFLVLERWMCCGLGRQCTLRGEDFDLDYPTECDDEYWFHPDPEKAFKQPTGEPCTVSYFVSALKQLHILGVALRVLYSSNKSKVLFNMLGPEKEKSMVTEFDSALNKWVDSVPSYLRWDPDREDSVFAKQSGHLWSSYYHLQILVHRPFITSRKSSTSGFPSLTICTNAARSCSRVIEAISVRYGGTMHQLTLPTFTCAIVLLVNMWGAMSAGHAVDHENDVVSLMRCVGAMKSLGRRFIPARQLSEILDSLATVDKFYDSFTLPSGSMRRLDIQRASGRKGGFCHDEDQSRRIDKPPRGVKPAPRAPHDQTGLYNAALPELSPQRLGEILQNESPIPAPRYFHRSSLVETCPVTPHSQSQVPLVGSPEHTMYEEMMSNFDGIFAVPPQATNSSVGRNGSASTGSIDTSGSYNPPNSGAVYALPYTATADKDAFALMSAAPASMVWEDWDAYILKMAEGTGVRSEVFPGVGCF